MNHSLAIETVRGQARWFWRARRMHSPGTYERGQYTVAILSLCSSLRVLYAAHDAPRPTP